MQNLDSKYKSQSKRQSQSKSKSKSKNKSKSESGNENKSKNKSKSKSNKDIGSEQLKKTYKINKNDLKYKNLRKINYDDLDTDSQKLYDSVTEDTDTIDNRVKESKSEYDTKMLDLNHIGIKTLPNISTTIQYLFLIDNELVNLNGIEKLVNLKVIDCSNNNISEIKMLPLSIEEFICSSNKLNNLDFLKIKCYNKLKYIDLTNNQVNAIENWQCPNLISLECGNNNIWYIQNFVSLEELDCCNNLLEELPSCENLKMIYCDHNKIVCIKNHTKLLELFCTKNKIKEIVGLKNVRYINCVDNDTNLRLPYFDTLIELHCDPQTNISNQYKVTNICMYGDKYASIFLK